MARILITRPNRRAQEFSRHLAHALKECEIIMSPIFETQFLKADIPLFDTAIFTSQFGVEAFIRLGGKPCGARALCVGRQTANAAQKAGFKAQASGYNVDDILAHILTQKDEKIYVHFRAKTHAGALVERANMAGKTVLFRDIYTQIPQDLSREARAALSDDSPLILPVFSPRAGAHLREILKGMKICKTTLIAMSAQVLEEMDTRAFASYSVLEKPTRAQMIRKIAHCLA